MRLPCSRHRTILAAAITTTATLAACGTNAPSTSATADPATPASSSMTMTSMPAPSAVTTAAAATAPVVTDHVAIQSFSFAPATIMVRTGTMVTWTQQDEDQHTVTADDASFASSPLTTGQTYMHTFTSPGTYHYHCSIHPFMHGIVVVTNG